MGYFWQHHIKKGGRITPNLLWEETEWPEHDQLIRETTRYANFNQDLTQARQTLLKDIIQFTGIVPTPEHEKEKARSSEKTAKLFVSLYKKTGMDETNATKRYYDNRFAAVQAFHTLNDQLRQSTGYFESSGPCP